MEQLFKLEIFVRAFLPHRDRMRLTLFCYPLLAQLVKAVEKDAALKSTRGVYLLGLIASVIGLHQRKGGKVTRSGR